MRVRSRSTQFYGLMAVFVLLFSVSICGCITITINECCQNPQRVAPGGSESTPTPWPNPGTFWGKVTNKNTGASIPGAQMAFDGPTDATVNRNTNGGYVSPLLNSGTYKITVTATGYQTINNTGVYLPPDGYVQKNYKMTPNP